MKSTLLVLLLWFWVTGTAAAAKPVSLAIPLSLQPYYIAESGTGLAYETLQAAFAASGRQIFPVYITQRDIDKVLARRKDIDCAGFQTKKDSTGWFSTDDIYPFHDAAVTLAANNIKIDKISDLRGKKVIAYHGASKLGAAFRAAIAENANYREIYNHRALVKLLLQNRVQVIVADKLLVRWYANYLAAEKGEPIELSYHNLFPPSQLKFTCRTQDLLQDFTDGLEKIRDNGELEKIGNRYIQ